MKNYISHDIFRTFILAFLLSFLSRRTFSLRERDMRQASYGRHSYHSDATTMSKIDAEREGMRAWLPIKIDMRVLPRGLREPRVESTHAFF
jgi:hypothetical protein